MTPQLLGLRVVLMGEIVALRMPALHRGVLGRPQPCRAGQTGELPDQTLAGRLAGRTDAFGPTDGAAFSSKGRAGAADAHAGPTVVCSLTCFLAALPEVVIFPAPPPVLRQPQAVPVGLSCLLCLSRWHKVCPMPTWVPKPLTFRNCSGVTIRSLQT